MYIRCGPVYFQKNKMFINKLFENYTTEHSNKGQHFSYSNAMRRAMIQEIVYKHFFFFENKLFYTQYPSVLNQQHC